jgi:glycosyltransferase involved in cell wall biosynthesis
VKRRRIHLWAPEFAGFGGGIGAYARELALALASDHDVELFGKADRNGEWSGLRLQGAGAAPGALRNAAFAALAARSCVSQRPDLVVSCHVNFGPVASVAAGARRIPYALVAHGIDVGPELAASRRLALRSAAAVWPVSRWTAARVHALGVRKARLSIVPNTVDELRFRPGERSPELLRLYGIAPGEKVVLTVARLDAEEAYKGCDRVIEALPSLDGRVRYVIAGSGNDAARLQALATQLGVADRVTFAGFVPDAELPAHYRLADVFAMPSRGEGFGIVFLEAMASGVPVLGGNCDGTVDALAEGALGRLVDPGDVGAISEALGQLVRREGPPTWFAPAQLRHACLSRFGRARFREAARSAAEAVLARQGRP